MEVLYYCLCIISGYIAGLVAIRLDLDWLDSILIVTLLCLMTFTMFYYLLFMFKLS